MLQVYTGAGKGKTTAAIGLAVRSLGAGHRVYMMQFMKSLAYSEQKILFSLAPQLVLATTGKSFFIAEAGADTSGITGDVVVFPKGQPPADYVALIEAGFDEAAGAVMSGGYQLAILDEINIALHFGLLRRERVEKFLDRAPQETELVLTGRNAPAWLIERADLVTEMREVKHYYARGVAARKGIEN